MKEFNFSKKVKPLFLSFLFGLIGIGIGQKMLSNETESILISHCRNLNNQNIFTFNKLSSVNILDNKQILEGLEIKKSCLKYISRKKLDEIDSLNDYEINSPEVLFEIIGYKFRLYADGFNETENFRFNSKRKFLISLLIFNVAALALQAIFLKADSEDLEED